MHLQPPNRVWQGFDDEYHERLNTHGMVLDRRTDIEHRDTMVYTIEKW